MLQGASEIKGFHHLHSNPNPRYLVPDLSPENRKELRKKVPRVVFVAESPHVSEVESEAMDHRRPLCGAAGRQWWGLLTEILEEQRNSDVELKQLLRVCSQYSLAIVNAVQFPLDPKVGRLFPEAAPIENLGFCKLSGEHSYKKLKKSKAVQSAILSLGARLRHPSLGQAVIHCLGNDAEWFVLQALSTEEVTDRLGVKIPHPSAWWRRKGLYGRVARERLKTCLKGVV